MRRSSGGLAEIFELGKKGKGRKRVKREKGKKKTLRAIKVHDSRSMCFTANQGHPTRISLKTT